MRRTVRYILAVFVIASFNFLIPRAMPGDPVLNLLGEDVVLSEDQIAEIRAELGLDRSLAVQYGRYWRDLFRLELGYSYHRHRKVSLLILDRLGWTLLLVGPASLLGAVAGALLGACAGWYSRHPLQRATTVLMLGIYSAPPFFLAVILLYLFSYRLGIFPLKGYYSSGTLPDIIRHLFLPATVLMLFSTTRNYMIMRGSVIQEKIRLYVTYARAKGLVHGAVLFRHVFGNASLPLITLVALDFGFIFSGALFVEIIFSMNGMGTLIYDALLSRDYPVLQGVFLVITLMVIAANFLADFLYTMIDPRVRLAR